MRSVFDQYSQPENRLTHALYCVLSRDRKLIHPFLLWLGFHDIPPLKDLQITEQSIPGVATEAGDGDDGLPDMCIYSTGSSETSAWGVFFEMKVQAKLSAGQLKRHRDTAMRFGFEAPNLVAVSVEAVSGKMPPQTKAVQWRKLYSWFATREEHSFWAAELVRYMEVFEEKAIDSEYDVRGTVTMFNGLRFDEERPYHYQEAKRLIRLLGDELQSRKDLEKHVGIDPRGSRRPAITNDGSVWDFIPLKAGKGQAFTQCPHLTMGIKPNRATASITIPNGISGGFRTRLKGIGLEGFLELVAEIEENFASVLTRSEGSKAFFYAVQRHYKSQKSKPQVDGSIELDLRTCAPDDKSAVKYQPQWIEAIYALLSEKKSNIQCGVEARFSYACPVVRSPEVADLYVETWKAGSPLLKFALGND